MMLARAKMIAMTITRIGIRVGISDMRLHLEEGKKHRNMIRIM